MSAVDSPQAIISVRYPVQYSSHAMPAPASSSSSTYKSTSREYALERFRRYRQLQEVAVMSPSEYLEAYDQGKLAVLKYYYSRNISELWKLAHQRLTAEEDKKLLEEGAKDCQTPRTATRFDYIDDSYWKANEIQSNPSATFTSAKSGDGDNSPVPSMASSMDASEFSALRGRLLKAAQLSTRSLPPTRPLPPSPPISPISSTFSAKGTSTTVSRSSSIASSRIEQSPGPSSLPLKSASRHPLSDLSQALPPLERAASQQLRRSVECPPPPDDGWLHPCEREIVIDEETYAELREAGRKRGEEEGWKGMASKAASLVKGKAKNRSDPTGNGPSSGTQHWERGPDY